MPCPEKFKDSLKMFGVEQEIMNTINEGYEEIVSKSPKKIKAAYFKRAVDIMNEQLPDELVREILEWNACCTSGTREKNSKAFARTNATLSIEERLEIIREKPELYMGSPELGKDGLLTIHAVSYWNEDRFSCACSNYNKVKRDYKVSKTYCYCCSGHFKYHYEIMLGMELKLKEVVSSPLDSDGKDPCVFTYELIGPLSN